MTQYSIRQFSFYSYSPFRPYTFSVGIPSHLIPIARPSNGDGRRIKNEASLFTPIYFEADAVGITAWFLGSDFARFEKMIRAAMSETDQPKMGSFVMAYIQS